MSKDKDARIRDGLLQQLYRRVLHCTLAASADGASAADAATAAGVTIHLRGGDTLLLPSRQAASFRVLQAPRIQQQPTRAAECERTTRIYTLPPEEPQAVSYALGGAMGALDQGGGAAVCVVLPVRAKRRSNAAETRIRKGQYPQSWPQAMGYAARLALPLLFISPDAAPDRRPAEPRTPAALYPTIPVDADDALAIYRVAYECLALAREQGGPSHLATLRLPGAAGPLDHLEQALRRRGCFTKAWQRALERELIQTIAGDSR